MEIQKKKKTAYNKMALHTVMMAIIKRLATNIREYVEKLEPSHINGGNVK